MASRLTQISLGFKGLRAHSDDVARLLRENTPAPPGTTEGPVWEEKEALKDALKGSLILLKNGSFAFVPTGISIKTRSGGTVVMFVRDSKDASKERDEVWLSQNVEKVWLGICTIDGSRGAFADSLKFQGGMPATLEPIPESPTSNCWISVAGGDRTKKPLSGAILADCLGLTGTGRMWAGGEPPSTWKQGAGLSKAADADATDVPVASLVGAASSADIGQLH